MSKQIEAAVDKVLSVKRMNITKTEVRPYVNRMLARLEKGFVLTGLFHRQRYDWDMEVIVNEVQRQINNAIPMDR